MGYELEETHYKLLFQDDLAGVEVTVRALTIAEALDYDVVRSRRPDSAEDAREWMREMAAFLSRALVSWNLTRKKKAVPTTVDGVLSLEWELHRRISAAWWRTTTGAPPPLDQSPTPDQTSGTGGVTETEIPMEPLATAS